MFKKNNLYKFLIILPILDLITSITSRFYNTPLSIGVFVKTLFLVVMVYYLIFKSNSKHKKLCLSYIILIFIYILGYYLSKIKYMTLGMFFSETIHLVKLLYFPILLASLYCYFDDNKLSKNELVWVLSINLIGYIILLFIPLITHTGFQTYEAILSGTIGWFFSANEISIILILLFPFIYSIFKKNKLFYVVIPILIILVISTIGTKSSMVGLIIDVIIIMILSCFYKKDNNKLNIKLILSSFIILVITLVIFSSSNSLVNLKRTFNIQEEQNFQDYVSSVHEEENLIKEEIEKLNNSGVKMSEKFVEFYNKYGKALLSDRDIYFQVTYMIYKQNFNFNTVLFGLGYKNNTKIDNFAVEKLIEMDPLDIFFHSGLIALIIILMPFVYYLVIIIKNKKITIKLVFYTLMFGMIIGVSFISGHTIMAPAVNIYIALYFILAYFELGLIEEKKYEIDKNKVTIYSLHMNYGGIEKDICNKANLLSKIYNVEIISVYKLNEKPQFKLNDKVILTYLTDNIRPNKEEFLKAVRSKNILKIIKEGLYSIKVLYLKDNLLNQSMINCNSEIIISTRIDFTKKLIALNDFNNIKISHEHIYHNNNKRYLKDLSKILKKVDYLMPSSNYLAQYYKNLFPAYSYKIVVNEMCIDTNNNVSNLNNKNIISVGRLSKEKGFEDLILLFSKIVKNYPDWVLNIVGDGPLYDSLNNLINILKLNDNIKLLGNQTTEQLNKLYEESSLYVMTSYEESFGLVLLEAMSHGLPVIAYSSALGAIEIIKDSDILIKDRNQSEMIKKISELLENKELRNKYQQLSLEKFKMYDKKIIEKNNIDFYSNIKKNYIFVNLYKEDKNEFYKLIDKRLKNKEKTFIITANPETFILSQSNLELNNIIYNKNNYVIPDGISIIKSAKSFGIKIKERITGVDLTEYLLKLANKYKYKVYLYGAKEEVIEKLEKNINKNYPNIKLVGCTNGYIKDKNGVMKYISTTKPDIVLVALGIPNQELLINQHLDSFDKGIFIGVGGTFDVLSGLKKRAPKLFIKLNLEWLYRIVCEPKRIIRFIKYNIRFVFQIIKERIFH